MSAADQQVTKPSEVDGKVIFVVDDERMIGDVVQIILRMDGYIPKFFHDPEVACRALQDEPIQPVLLLTDFLMAPINGMQLIERCKHLRPHLRTILYSGNVDEGIIQTYAVQPNAFLRKPFLPRTLLDLVRSTLSTEAGCAPAPIRFA
jgi:DNA-binding NtrC family response regulator